MTGFEHLVRPFQTGAITPAENVPPAQIVAGRNVVINPGAGGQVKTMGGSFDLTITYYLINKPTEEIASP